MNSLLPVQFQLKRRRTERSAWGKKFEVVEYGAIKATILVNSGDGIYHCEIGGDHYSNTSLEEVR